MLIEYLQTEYPEYVQRLHDIPGAHVFQFTLSGSPQEYLSAVSYTHLTLPTIA